MSKRTSSLTMAIALSLALASPALAQTEITPVVEGGLDSPRGVAIGPDGTIYVAESGAGGEDACLLHPELAPEEPGICYGTSSGISAIVDGTPTRVIDGLVSGITPTGETLGASDVAVDEMGGLWFTVGLGAPNPVAFRESVGDLGSDMGFLFKADGEGGHEPVADFATYEKENNPDADQPGNEEPDSNPNGIALTAEGALVADAGGNALLLTDAVGNISLVAVFPSGMAEAPVEPDADPVSIPVDPVPTAVSIGPDGAYYVGMLTGFPFAPGTATVQRVVPGEAPTEYAGGFTNVIDIGFAPDGSLYVLEISHDGMLNADPEAGPPRGGLWKVPAGGGDAELVTNELVMPGGMAVAEDGTVLVSTCAICPGGGGIVSVSP
jgi:sugar lactone lactonase YvrE